MENRAEGYVALPEKGAGPGVLVLHAWWGLNETIQDVCKRLAEEGFVAFALDMYHGEVAMTIPEAEVLGKKTDENFEQVRQEVAAAARFLLQQREHAERGIAVMGFSLGAYYALDVAASDPEHVSKVVLFYGTGPGDWEKSRADYLGHFAENDPYEPLEGVARLEEYLKQHGRAVEFHRYAGAGHWFFEPDREDTYNEAAAKLAWERTVNFLKGKGS